MAFARQHIEFAYHPHRPRIARAGRESGALPIRIVVMQIRVRACACVRACVRVHVRLHVYIVYLCVSRTVPALELSQADPGVLQLR